MPSTPSTSLKLELIANGEQSGLWGTTTNTNLGTLLEQAICGNTTITMVDADYTLTNYNYVVNEARSAVLVATGTNAAIRDIIAPLVPKFYAVKNSTTGGFAINIRAATGTAVLIPNGSIILVYCDGTNFYPVAPPANSIPSGLIAMWSGLISAIPVGWLLCDGTNGTPNLRDRFIVGAGGTYAPSATGGNADSIVVSHTHTANSTVTPGSNTGIQSANHTHTDSGHLHNIPVTYIGSPGPLLNAGTTVNTGITPSGTNTGTGHAVLGVQTANHTHAIGAIPITTTVTAAGVAPTGTNLPPYFALCMIMKV